MTNPCCCQWGCLCRLTDDNVCRVCDAKAKQKTNTLETITLGRALSKAEPPGYTDVWSGLGEIWFDDATGGTWVKAHPDFVLRVGKVYRWRDRQGRESMFAAMTK